MNGKSFEQISEKIKDKRIKNKKAEIKDAIEGEELNLTDIFVINECLDAIRFIKVGKLLNIGFYTGHFFINFVKQLFIALAFGRYSQVFCHQFYL